MAKELTDKQQAFLNALPYCDGDLEKTKLEAGYSKDTALNSIIKPIKDEVLEICKMILAANAPRATLQLIRAIDDPTSPGLPVKMKAILEVLDRVGVVKEDKVEITSGKDVLFILPAKNRSSEEDTHDIDQTLVRSSETD